MLAQIKKWKCFTLTLFLLIPILNGCKEKGPIGSRENPLKMMFVPSDESGGILTSAKQIETYLEKSVSKKLYGQEKGFFIDVSVPNSYIAVVEAFGTKRADLAIMNTYGYYLLKVKKNFPVEALARIVRGEGESTYKSQFIVRADSKINSLKDLAGKKFAFTDPSSTSGYVVPSSYLKRNGINIGESVFGARHDSVVTMVYQGQVEAGATYYFPNSPDGKMRDARSRVITQFPDVYQKVKVIGYTFDIPNAPWVLRTSLYGQDTQTYEKVKMALKTSIVEYANSPEGRRELTQMYGITGLEPASDKDFARVLEVFLDAEEDPIQAKKK